MDLYKETLRSVYRDLGSFSEPYEVDFKRFLYSLELLGKRNLIRGKRILDLGCGVGIMALALRKLGADASGVDKFIFPSAPGNQYRIADMKALQRIWEKHGLVVAEHDILTRLPFADGTFDAVISDATIEHLLHSPKGLFVEVHRVLAPKGVFLVTTPNFANLLRRVRFMFGRSPMWDLKDYFDRGEHFTGHRREFTIGELRTMLKWTGFSVPLITAKNSFFNWRRLLHPQKALAHIAALLSMLLPKMKEMIFALAMKE
ncbi:MAG: methyltransferase domain-containing protein [Candidatus Harrisonbacteria bacterium]|nr:methyltransferase domain-containing protein [Candidatus Harrisonbacteria bacterium]